MSNADAQRTCPPELPPESSRPDDSRAADRHGRLWIIQARAGTMGRRLLHLGVRAARWSVSPQGVAIALATVFISAATLLVGYRANVLIDQQNDLVRQQNVLVTKQYELMQMQVQAETAARRATISAELSNTMDQFSALPLDASTVPEALQRRIAAATQAYRPLPVVDSSGTWRGGYSPERGQTLLYLNSYGLKWELVGQDGVFDYADLAGARIQNFPSLGRYTDDAAGLPYLRNLAGANLEGCHIFCALFNQTILEGAIFDNAELSMVRFEGAHLQNSSFVNAELSEVIFGGGTIMPPASAFRGAKFQMWLLFTEGYKNWLYRGDKPQGGDEKVLAETYFYVPSPTWLDEFKQYIAPPKAPHLDLTNWGAFELLDPELDTRPIVAAIETPNLYRVRFPVLLRDPYEYLSEVVRRTAPPITAGESNGE